MDEILGLFLLMAIVAGIFGAGFYLGYRYRDNLSIQRHKKSRPSKPHEANHPPAPSAAPSPSDSPPLTPS
ncbi:MAG: hypothetical protein ABSG66_09545 [Stellaceae bacterium]|jgi:hypothetical protein